MSRASAKSIRSGVTSPPDFGAILKKRCPRCEEELAIDAFNLESGRKDGHQQWCRTCLRAYLKQRRGPSSYTGISKTPRYKAGARLERKYGLTLQDYDAMVVAQQGRCAICEAKPEGVGSNGSLNVDHCHKTGKVRGLLCLNCNQGIGKLQDDPALLDRATRYLRFSSPPSRTQTT